LNSEKLFLSRREVLQALQLSVSSLRRRVLSGEIPCVHVGRRVLFPRSYVENLEAQAYRTITEGREQ
jgi:excisionase family DNA binding protein